ncbi:CRISPR-associated protein Cas5 [Porphyromonadaceae sp. NP-X]|nr:CRISPR-associated protein Cas5 [Porphyromonadaceae sp. NP-X]NLJ19513.1 CRISPR-associated protein Cas5 [Bacteroidales bacterium]
MRIVCSGSLNSFRQPDFHTYHKTLPLPPKTTVAGMIGSALGISPEKVNEEWIKNNRFQMGIVGKNNGKANDLWQIRKYENKQLKAYQEGNESAPYKTAVIVRELLYSSEFILYLHFEDENDYELVSSKLQNPEWALSLGREDELVLIKEIRQMNLEEKSNISFCNTVLPIDFTKTPYEIVLSTQNSSGNLLDEAPKSIKLPITFSYNDDGAREANEYQQFSFIYNLPIKPKDSRGFYDEELNYSFQIF